MRTKSSLFSLYTSQCDFDVYVITETWLNSDFYDEEFFNPYNFVVFRKDRDALRTGHSRGGGVLIAVKKSLFCRSIALSNNDTLIDQLCVAIKAVTGELYICVSYIPPGSCDSLYAAHSSNILNLAEGFKDGEKLCLLGDFNLNEIVWSEIPNSKLFLPSNLNKSLEINFIDSTFSIDLIQINTVFNRLNKLLDLVFVSSDLKFNLSESAFPISPSNAHHSALEVVIEFYEYASSNGCVDVQYNYYACDFNALNYSISNLNWNVLLDNDIVSICYEQFLSSVVNVVNQNIPVVLPKVYKLPWYTKGLKKLKNLRNKFHKKFKISNNATDKNNFLHYEREFNFLNKFLYNQYIMSVNESIKLNPKRFWSFVNSKRGTSAIPAQMSLNGTISNSLKDSLNLFAFYFKSNFNADNFHNGFDLYAVNSCLDFGSLQITDDDVAMGIVKLSNSFKCDTDGLSAYLLKQCVSSIASPLRRIFNQSLRAGFFIQKWKNTTVFPILKSGNRNDISNYRPISKLSNVAKVFEHIVYDKLFFQLKRFISTSQHGFMTGRSTTTNLAVFTNFCISHIEKGVQIDSIYTDFAKAFDRVPHELLLLKLSKIGFHSEMLSWFRYYLTGRSCTVSIDGVCSDYFIPTSGIPQGSILGPLLFNIFINDLGHCFENSKFLLYADDLKIFKPICNERDVSELQNDLDRVVLWSERNGLSFNVDKCRCMTFHRRRQALVSQYNISGNILSSVDEILDLGVVLDTKLNFCSHLNYIVPKAYSLLSFIRRNISTLFDFNAKKTIFSSLVRSRLEYASFIWSPSASVHVNRVEKIQVKFLKYTFSSLNFSTPLTSYEHRCIWISMKSLESRRKISSLVFLHGIICGLIDSPDLLGLIKILVPQISLRRNNLLHIDFHRTEYGRNEPLTKSMRLFNNLCNILDLSMSANDFKTNLNKLL